MKFSKWFLRTQHQSQVRDRRGTFGLEPESWRKICLSRVPQKNAELAFAQEICSEGVHETDPFDWELAAGREIFFQSTGEN
jgi:hypothetical protein